MDTIIEIKSNRKANQENQETTGSQESIVHKSEYIGQVVYLFRTTQEKHASSHYFASDFLASHLIQTASSQLR